MSSRMRTTRALARPATRARHVCVTGVPSMRTRSDEASRQRLTLRQYLRSTNHQTLDRIGAAKEAPQLIRQADADHGEHFVQSFRELKLRRQGTMIELTRQVPENPLILRGGRTVPSLTQYLLDSGTQ